MVFENDGEVRLDRKFETLIIKSEVKTSIAALQAKTAKLWAGENGPARRSRGYRRDLCRRLRVLRAQGHLPWRRGGTRSWESVIILGDDY